MLHFIQGMKYIFFNLIFDRLITANKTKETHSKQKLFPLKLPPSGLSHMWETQKEKKQALSRRCLFPISHRGTMWEMSFPEAGDAMKHLPPRDRNRMKINTVFVTRQIVSDIWRSAMQDNYSKWHWPTLTYHYSSRSAGRKWKHLNGAFCLQGINGGWKWMDFRKIWYILQYSNRGK